MTRDRYATGSLWELAAINELSGARKPFERVLLWMVLEHMRYNQMRGPSSLLKPLEPRKCDPPFMLKGLKPRRKADGAAHTQSGQWHSTISTAGR